MDLKECKVHEKYRVGCALMAKKAKRYLTPSMLQTAAASGVELQLIDPSQPLDSQGPFHAILHKLRPDEAWEGSLRGYVARYPETRIIDRLDCIRTLQNRATMLSPLDGGGLVIRKPAPCCGKCTAAEQQPAGQRQEEQQREQQQQGQQQQGDAQPEPPLKRQHLPRDEQQQQRQQQQEKQLQEKQGEEGPSYDEGDGEPDRALVQAPPQVQITEGMTEAEARAALAAAGLCPPLLFKPLWTDGREGSHGLAVLHDLGELGQLLRGALAAELRPPLVAQRFVEHGGVLFKVYVMGQQTVLTRRPSLSAPQLDTAAGVQKLPRVSCATAVWQAAVGPAAALPGPGSGALGSVGALREASNGGGGGPWERQGAAAAEAEAEAAALEAKAQLAAATRTPPEWVIRAVAAALRVRLGVMLFNFDMICPLSGADQDQQQWQDDEEEEEERQQHERPQPGGARALVGCDAGCGTSHVAAGGGSANRGGGARAAGPQGGGGGGGGKGRLGGPPASSPRQLQYLVVDINYFPGVDKLPGFERRLVEFLRGACEGEPPLPSGGGDWRLLGAPAQRAQPLNGEHRPPGGGRGQQAVKRQHGECDVEQQQQQQQQRPDLQHNKQQLEVRLPEPALR